jgi:hypothetical protein
MVIINNLTHFRMKTGKLMLTLGITSGQISLKLKGRGSQLRFLCLTASPAVVV